VVPEDHVRTVERLQQSLFICPPHASQIAALAALDCEAELEAMRRVYEGNRQLMLDGLPRAGIARFAPPDGAFYVYADVGHLTDDSLGFARRLLEEAGVATAPGVDFDQARGHRWLRLSYAGSPADVAEGLDRLSGFTRAL
jgi:aspartate/methionine/tyrosine aminotransferase